MTRNVSHGGICVEITKRVKELLAYADQKDVRLLVHLELSPSGSPVRLEGTASWGSSRIDWVQKPSKQNSTLVLGVAFEDLSDETREQIHNYILGEFVKNYGVKPA